ncbi:MAG TPA: Na+/H+ antiporter subunit E [Pseudonocardiaceae bacterium]|jgi:multisubunit Na+/H+ antiporter MnhE subunit|nr:Na+/H+ antiporter subunit E [Pseudonocardiaceae bacterium]
MRGGLETFVWWVILVGVWLATLSAFSFEELAVAAVLALPCAVAAGAARRAAEVRWTVGSGWAQWLLALPGAVLHDTAAVLRLGMRWQRREDEDEFRRVPLPTESADGRRAGREAVTTEVLSATPGSVVVDADEHDGLLVHAMPIGRTRLEQETTG